MHYSSLSAQNRVWVGQYTTRAPAHFPRACTTNLAVACRAIKPFDIGTHATVSAPDWNTDRIPRHVSWQQRTGSLLLASFFALVATPEASFGNGLQQEQPQQYALQSRGCNTLSEVAGLFGSSFADEKDPVNAFTLYGTVMKKFLIEVLDGEKVVSRKKGFTATACAGVVEESRESPQFQGLPIGDKMLAGDNAVCKKSEAADLKEACVTACSLSCSTSVERYAEEMTQRSGLVLDEKDKSRITRSCNRDCAYECSKPGKTSSFIVPYRR